ncbi:hypothetical protein I4I73_03350 [Pseudonocardia sp. KRD-184]|uniref:DNA-binding protein n=1 Tax=Pseudonocardia oceani TaxID=2792013 RepID=A0ABS6UK59_9PSEU|nr:hypothetical protein [Pseudonocardia oceani]MBW0088251.1 hypothetical protein [Pseudonocardia oceani]MBW0095033.1 hypothetical protein [Pseudonocardia oceani]MBW0121114.1 hypothetical protein [Pseudonocardia oceani]MBW0131200.1 hypothetical protein [Pseudonocardia oceani]MBW0132633.1 hypothetical protein [Pseudonocardia oceani]
MNKPRLCLLDTEAIAFHYSVAPGTVRRWASEEGWHRYGTRRHRLWSLAQAQQSVDEREERRRRAEEKAACA